MGERRRSLQDRIRARQSDVFVGRSEQLRQFEQNLQLPFDDPRQRFLFSVFGDAGIGKTFLVRQLARVAREKGWRTATVDHTVLDVPGTMASIVGQLDQAGLKVRRYSERYASYQSRRGELAADPDAPDGLSSLLTKTVVRVGLHAAGDVPIAGALAEAVDKDAAAEQADRLRRFLAGKFRNHDDLRLVMSPVAELTPAFVADVAQACEQAPLALFFDTYERTGVFLDGWLLDLLEGRYGDLPENLIITVAGQHPLDPNRWAPFYGLRAEIPLRVFTDDEARELLTARGVTDPRVIDVILTLSGRLPVLLAMLAESRPATPEEIGDPSGDAVERFLRWEEDDAHRQAAQLAALPRAVDADRVAAVLDLDDAAAAETFARLRRFPFVSVRAEGSRQYHDVVRDPMLRQIRRDSPSLWRAAHLRLAELYQTRRDATGLSGREGIRDDAWQTNAVETIYHRLCAHEPSALTDTAHHLIDTWSWSTPEATRRVAEAIATAGRDAAHPEAARRAAAILAPLTAVPPDPVALLTILLQDSTCDAIHLARALAARGETHHLNGSYEAALTDFNRTIELVPDDAWVLGNLGQTYRIMGRYDDALTDLNRALDITPDRDWILADRGETHRLNGNHEAALTDFTRAIELDPDYTWALVSRAETYQAVGRHDDALADLNRAIEVDQQDEWCHYLVWLFRQAGGADIDASAEAVRALDLGMAALERAPDNARLAFNVAVFLLALDREDDAEERALGTLAAGARPAQIRECIDDLEQLQRIAGKNTEKILSLLRGA